jgi:hypothetical protein
MAALEQSISYKCQLRVGDMFEIRSSIVELREKTIRLRHDMHKVNVDALAASTSILAVHLDTDARKSLPLPLGLPNAPAYGFRRKTFINVRKPYANPLVSDCNFPDNGLPPGPRGDPV